MENLKPLLDAVQLELGALRFDCEIGEIDRGIRQAARVHTAVDKVQRELVVQRETLRKKSRASHSQVR